MFESLHDGLLSAFKTLRGKGKLTEANMREGLALVERSLLEADVSYPVVVDFMNEVNERALGQKVLNSLNPSQQLVGIVHEELVRLMGPVDSALHLQAGMTVIMLCGLQGSGKTTTCGKLARLIQQAKHRPHLIAADLQRPAAIDQLTVIGQQLGVGVYANREEKNPVTVCKQGIAAATEAGANVCILDTAGRLAIDRELMDELKAIDRMVQPHQVYLVVDGMTGQDAVNSADAFNKALELNGVIMTKLDGDARGGAVLSVKHITGVPIKFLGTGEQLTALEVFRPEGMAGRILGMGDVVALVQSAQAEFDEQQMKKAEERMLAGQFTLEDFKNQLQQLAKPGLLQRFLTLMPGMADLRKMTEEVDAENDMKGLIGVIDSMTPAERRDPSIIDMSRRRRIAAGAGVEPHHVNELVKQFSAMAGVMKQMAGKGVGDRVRMMQEMQRSGAFHPGANISAAKGSTGKRLSPKERAKLKKEREKELRKRRRETRGRD